MHEALWLGLLPNDQARYEYCRAQWSFYRNAYYLGRQKVVDTIIKSKDLRYRHMNEEHRSTVGSMIWSSSVLGKDYKSKMESWGSWAVMYSEFCRR